MRSNSSAESIPNVKIIAKARNPQCQRVHVGRVKSSEDERAEDCRVHKPQALPCPAKEQTAENHFLKQGREDDQSGENQQLKYQHATRMEGGEEGIAQVSRVCRVLAEHEQRLDKD